MDYIKAPYNFVPLNKVVVPVYWGEHISHDIPFAEYKSGTIEINIQTHSPIFVRNSPLETSKEQDSNFSTHKGRQFIPGSSIKGAIRNVLSIMSFSKIELGDDISFAYRDLTSAMKEAYQSEMTVTDLRCGWLTKDGNIWRLCDHGFPARIQQEFIPKFPFQFFRKKNKGSASNRGGFNFNSTEHKSAAYKYRQFERAGGKLDVEYEIEGKYAQLSFGGKKGVLVFTGQPGPNDHDGNGKNKGKYKEFIFPEIDASAEEVPDKVVRNFLFAYYDHDMGQAQPDWKAQKQKLENRERIPVFFRRDKKTNELRDMGLSYLYKANYDQSLHALSDQQNKEQIDMAKAIFGYIGKNSALKGRVQFGHAFIADDEKVELLETQAQTLSSPKPTYYPTYLRNTGKKGTKLNTYNDASASISGWKRYPIRNQIQTNESGTRRTATKFTPIKEGAKFTFTLAYHNLRSVELGALISALTFHNSHGLHHSIGMAKPLGYGRVSFELNTAKNFEQDLAAYQQFMDYSLKKPWLKTEQIVELASMAQPQANTDMLGYMKLKNDYGKNEFVQAKNEKEYLELYSKLTSSGAIKPLPIKERIDFEKDSSLFKDIQFEANQHLINVARTKQQDFQNLKKDLLQQIDTLRKQQEEQLREEKRKSKAKEEASAAFTFELDPSKRNIFNDLKKAVEWRIQTIEQTKYNKLAEKADGWLPTQDRSVVAEYVRLIKDNLPNKKEEKKWGG